MFGKTQLGGFGVLLFFLILLLYFYLWTTPVAMYVFHSFPERSRSGVTTTHAEQVDGLSYVDALLYCYDEGMTHWMVNDRIEEGTLTVVVEITDTIPESMLPGLSIDAHIRTGVLEDVVFVAADRMMIDADATLKSAHEAVETLSIAA